MDSDAALSAHSALLAGVMQNADSTTTELNVTSVSFHYERSGNGGDTANWVRHKLKIYQRRLDGTESRPATKVIDRYAVQQVAPRVAVAKDVSANAPSRRDRAYLLRPFHSGLHPSGRPLRQGRLDYPALPHASI